MPGFANGTTAQACVVWDDDCGHHDDENEDEDSGNSNLSPEMAAPSGRSGKTCQSRG